MVSEVVILYIYISGKGSIDLARYVLSIMEDLPIGLLFYMTPVIFGI